jgi:hypothetical protein
VPTWWSAGANVAARLGDRYAFLAAGLGSAAEQALGGPGADTLEGVLSAVPGSHCHFHSGRLAAALDGRTSNLWTDTSADVGY